MAEKETLLMKKAIIALVVLIVAAVASVGTLIAVKNSKEKEKQQASKVLAENDIFSFDPYSPTKIVFSKGDETYTAEKKDEVWSLDNGEFELDQNYCQLICTYLSDLTAETNYGEITDEKLDMYGLRDTDTIEVTEPSGTHTIHIGNESPMQDYYYVTADGRDKVFAIEYMKGSVLKLDRLLLKNKMLLPYDLYSIKEVIISKEGKTTLDVSYDEDTQLWSLPEEYSLLQLDPTSVTAKLNGLVRLESQEMLDEKLDDLEKYGLDKPYAEMTVKGLDGTQRNLKFCFNDDYPDYCIVLVDGEQVELYYKAGLDIIDYTAYNFIVQNYIAARSYNTKEFTLNYNGNSDEFKVDIDNNECTVNGKKISIESTENYLAFDNFFNSVSVLKLTGTDVEAKPELKDPELTAEFTFTEGDPVKIDLVKGEGTSYYVFRDGEYTGGFIDETTLKGRNSLSEFYLKFKNIAGF